MQRRAWKWVFVLNAIVFGFGARASLPPYELIAQENQDFRDWKREDLVAKLGVTAEDLKAYACDGKREYELLPPLRKSNPAGDSLRVELYEPESEWAKDYLIYKDGALYKKNGKKAGAGLRGNVFVTYAETALKKLAALPSGKIMLDRLQHSPYPLTIRYGAPHFWPMEDRRDAKSGGGMHMAQAVQFLATLRKPDYGNQFDRVGTGGYIDYDPKFEHEFLESDGKQRKAEAHVILAHEMFHAFDGIRGLFERRMVWGAAYESGEALEHRGVYFENKIREESGLFYRKNFGLKPYSGSLLGEDGKPMLIPAACIPAGDAARST